MHPAADRRRSSSRCSPTASRSGAIELRLGATGWRWAPRSSVATRGHRPGGARSTRAGGCSTRSDAVRRFARALHLPGRTSGTSTSCTTRCSCGRRWRWPARRRVRPRGDRRLRQRLGRAVDRAREPAGRALRPQRRRRAGQPGRPGRLRRRRLGRGAPDRAGSAVRDVPRRRRWSVLFAGVFVWIRADVEARSTPRRSAATAGRSDTSTAKLVPDRHERRPAAEPALVRPAGRVARSCC